MDSTARATGAEALALIGRRLRDLRQGSRLSQRAAAEAVGLPQSNLSRIENGKQRLNLATLARVLSVFDLTMQEFFAGARQDEPTTVESEREIALVAAWRRLDDADRRAVEEFARFRAQRSRARDAAFGP